MKVKKASSYIWFNYNSSLLTSLTSRVSRYIGGKHIVCNISQPFHFIASIICDQIKFFCKVVVFIIVGTGSEIRTY